MRLSFGDILDDKRPIFVEVCLTPGRESDHLDLTIPLCSRLFVKFTENTLATCAGAR